ncbi:AAA family ATPase [Mucilaginibacter sp. SJ]|uniref:AAA family ATPase n=1 Tax=Mucilaginibacter sp. SJ TaxID=3029053 RepID=UPI0023A958D6|nr:AAA family ATPase [Mucilaginibacter sp. SJ]WEA00602.1 AAA family ATPase [Mucilaginibacter sp. SJ]
MELLYIWIEEFRNLKNIGFNFTDKIKFDYLPEHREVLIEKKEPIRPGFFGKKVNNVTAIIGKNGTGKSNLLDLICYLTKGSSKRFYKFIIIYEDARNRGQQYICKTNIEELSKDKRLFIIDAGKSIPNIGAIFFSNVNDGREHRFARDIIDISQNSTSRHTRKRSDVFNQLKFLLSDHFEAVNLSAPNTVLLTTRADITIKKPLQTYLSSYPKFEALVKLYSSGLKRHKPAEQFRYSLRYTLFIYSLNHVFSNFIDNSQIGLSGNETEFVNTFTTIFQNRFPKADLPGMSDTHERLEYFLRDFMDHYKQLGEMNVNELYLFLDFDRDIPKMNLIIAEEKISKKTYFKAFFDEFNQGIFKRYNAIFDFPEIIDLEWTGMSSGHKAFLNLFAQLHSTIKRIAQQENVLVCIDEGDLYLHPEWQRQFLNRVIRYVPEMLNKNLQFILTTHSPFLISDLPKENLILVQSNSFGNCEIATNKITLRQTFGANIYDLFRGPFVLEKSTISEFALRKINRAVAILSQKAISRVEYNEARDIVSAVGDYAVHFKLDLMLKDAETLL